MPEPSIPYRGVGVLSVDTPIRVGWFLEVGFRDKLFDCPLGDGPSAVEFFCKFGVVDERVGDRGENILLGLLYK